jgi:hypothetical protein
VLARANEEAEEETETALRLLRLEDVVRHSPEGVGFFTNAFFEAPAFFRIARVLELAPEVD